MFYILSYDISDDKLRLKVSKHLLASGCFRLQKSVFIAPSFTTKQIRQLKAEVLKILKHPNKVDTDSLLCFHITPKQIPNIWWQKPTPEVNFIFDYSEWF